MFVPCRGWHSQTLSASFVCGSILPQDQLLIEAEQIIAQDGDQPAPIGGAATQLRDTLETHRRFLYTCMFSGPLGDVRSSIPVDRSNVPWLVIEGFMSGAVSPETPWLLSVGSRVKSLLHRDCEPNTKRVDLSGKGGSILTLVLCLRSSKPYRMRFYAVESSERPSDDNRGYVEVEMRAGSWQLFPSRLWHIVTVPCNRLIVSIMFQLR